eukprot:scaffold14624_cov100-Cylindrotheca_fusiformis.AAC.8
MTKRTSDTILRSYSQCQLPQEKSRTKRPRTESFVREKINHENLLHTCSYIRQGVASLRAEQRSKSNPWRIHPNRAESAQSSESNIQKQISIHEHRFRSKCRKLNVAAEAAINLSQGFDQVSAAIDMDVHGNDDMRGKCLLPMLHTGPETTAEMKLLISQFAGVPSSQQLDDMQQLRRELARYL